MSITEKLDLAIKLKEKGSSDGAYEVTHNGKFLSKAAYMTNEEWKAFADAMQKYTPSAYKEYSEGDGGELDEKNGRPPKMASYGSSSRLIYTLSREKSGFHFEKKLHTTVGGTANLDGFYEDGNRYIFVEAKCHEPYTAKNNSVSARYSELYEYITERMMGNLQIEMEKSKCGRYMNVKYLSDGEEICHFDVKQMICHLLGIATGVLSGELENKQTDFIYLLYDPTELDVSPDAKTEIDRIYERTCYECNLIDFQELYRVILTYLRDKKLKCSKISGSGIDLTVCKFTFTLASQDFYKILMQ